MNNHKNLLTEKNSSQFRQTRNSLFFLKIMIGLGHSALIVKGSLRKHRAGTVFCSKKLSRL